MGFEDVDGLDRVFYVSPHVNCLDRQHSVHSHRSKQVVVAGSNSHNVPLAEKISRLLANNFARHAGLGRIDQRIPPQNIHLDAQLILHELDRLPARQTVPSDDCGGVDLGLDELIRPPQKLCRDYHDRCSPVANLFVLFLCEIYKYASCRVLD